MEGTYPRYIYGIPACPYICTCFIYHISYIARDIASIVLNWTYIYIFTPFLLQSEMLIPAILFTLHRYTLHPH